MTIPTSLRWLAALLLAGSLLLSPAESAAQTNLMQNGGFESGATGWTDVSTNGLPIITNQPTEARTGSWVAWLGGYNGTDTISQAFSIPATAQRVRLQFWYRIETSITVESDRMRVAIIDPPATTLLLAPTTLSNRDATNGWAQSSIYDISAFRGQTVRLQFQSITPGGTSFFIDDVAVTMDSLAATNYSDLWWNPNESGWGLTIADHETELFVVWYTYLPGGRPTWFVVSGGTFSSNRQTFTGTLYSTTGSPYNTTFDPSAVRTTPVGSITLNFAPSGLQPGWATFSYVVNGVSGSKNITRQPFGNAPSRWGMDLTDIWWNSGQSGWGLTLAQHGNNVFGVLFIYDTDGSPTFIVMPGASIGSSSLTGRLYVANSGGQAWNTPSWNPSLVSVTDVGSATIGFQGGLRNPNDEQKVSATTLGWTIRNYQFTTIIARQPFGNAPVQPGSTRALGIQITGNGSVQVNPGGTCLAANNGGTWGTICAYAPALGQGVSMTAAAAQGWRFAGWRGDCSGMGSCNLTMSSDHTVTAVFEQTTTAMVFTALNPPDGTAQVIYPAYCFCSPAPAGTNDLCSGGVNPSGGRPPYTFRLDSGVGFPPFGMTLFPNGCLRGTPSAAGTSTFSVCAVDQSATAICRTTQMTIRSASRACVGGWTLNVVRFGCPGGFVTVNGGVRFEGLNFTLTTGTQTGTLIITSYPQAFSGCSVSSSATVTTPVVVNYANRGFEFNTIDGRFSGNYAVNAGGVAGQVAGADRIANFACAPAN